MGISKYQELAKKSWDRGIEVLPLPEDLKAAQQGLFFLKRLFKEEN